MTVARFFDKLDNDKVKCHLCAHECTIDPGKRGICAVRENRAGTLYSLVYGRIISGNADPIEKKPLFHFLPGTRSYSIATVGCNLQCQHCQNYDISQYPRRHEKDIPGKDLKSFSNSFYRKVCKAKLQPVLDTITRMKALGVWIEVTTLIIPGLNDSDAELRDIAQFLNTTGPEIPWHVTAFYPTYKMLDRPPTPLATLRRAREIGLAAGLRYVYTGNIPGDPEENTFCPKCKQMLIERSGFTIRQNRIVDGACPDCRARIDGIWQ